MKNQNVEQECWFLIPILRDSDRKPHEPMVWRLLQENLLILAAGWTGPEGTHLIRKLDLVPGGWKPEGEIKPTEDESRKYTVIITQAKFEMLRTILKKAANSFDQQEILLCIRGRAHRIIRNPEDGFLE